MTNEFAADVLICGAGAAGLTLGIELARRGYSFRLIERRANPFHGSRGKGIQPRTQEIFEDLGLLDKAVASGGVYPPLRVYHPDGSYSDKTPVVSLQPKPAEPYHLALMIPQFMTEQIMRDRLAELGHAVEFGCELTGFEQDESGVTAQISGPTGEEALRIRYLVGADGGRSFVRSALAIEFPGKALGVRALVADVEMAGLGREAWHQFNDGNMERMLAICPLAGTDLFQMQAPVPLDGEVDLSVEGLTRIIGERTNCSEMAVQSVAWASAYTMNARLADRYRIGRTFLVGDAAHIHPPTGGQGLNTSVQDAYNLGWKLAAVLSGAPDSLLDTYEKERRPVAEAVLGLSTRLLDAQRQGGMRRGREVNQLDIGYPDSPLSKELSGGSRLPPGDRAPDAPVRGAAGQGGRLFQLFQGPHWTLLIHEGDCDIVAPRPGLRVYRLGHRGDVVDAWGYVREAYGLASGEGVLIRPDGYVGATFDRDKISELEAYLTNVGIGCLERRA